MLSQIAETILIFVEMMIDLGHDSWQIVNQIAILVEEEVMAVVLMTVAVMIAEITIAETIDIRTQDRIEIEKVFPIEIDQGMIEEMDFVLGVILSTEKISNINAVPLTMIH